jgi:hypothetical protein
MPVFSDGSALRLYNGDTNRERQTNDDNTPVIFRRKSYNQEPPPVPHNLAQDGEVTRDLSSA